MGARRWAEFVVDGGRVNLDRDLEVRTLQGRPVLARDCTPEMIVVVQTVAGPVQAVRADRDWKGGVNVDGTFVAKRGDAPAHDVVLSPTRLRRHASQGRVTLHLHTSGEASTVTLDWAPSVKTNVRRVLQRMLLQLVRCEHDVTVNVEVGTIGATATLLDQVVATVRSFLAEHDVEVQVSTSEASA
jgi:hypothetical protein